MILVVKWFAIQVAWTSPAGCFKWFRLSSLVVTERGQEKHVIYRNGSLRTMPFADLDVSRCLIWDSSDLVVFWFEVQMILVVKWFAPQCYLNLKNKTSKTNHFCNTSFKNEALKLKNEAFLRDFLQNWSCEAQKRSFSARLPSKMKLWNSKTKHFCETSFKNEALKLKNEAFLRDFLQKWSFETQKRNFSARLPSKLKLWSSKTKLFCETSFKNDTSTRHLTSELQYVLAIFNWMLQKYCACHEKVEPRHTNSCNCHAKWSLQSNTSVTWKLQPSHGFSVGRFKHRHQKARNPCACHAKRIVSDPLQIHHACQRFCNPHKLLRLLRILQRVEIPAPATRNTLSTSKNVPSTWCFNDFDFQIDLARRRGANFAKINFQKCSEHATF